MDVDQRDLRNRALRNMQRLFAVRGEGDVVTQLFECLAINVAHRLVIVDEENPLKRPAVTFDSYLQRHKRGL